ncbi:MAG: hypothetical protein L0Z68_04110 [Gammaproteobacteria bacterium]|nr:hypothetical protein [Gammaproteobacteria bacterium]
MRNLLVGEKEHQHAVVVHSYDPDGNLLDLTEAAFELKPKQETARPQCHMGLVGLGRWPLGTYCVYIFIDGENIGKEQFTIYEDRDLEIQKLRFFESGDSAPEVSERKYTSRFSKKATRFIWWEVQVKNLLKGHQDHRHTMIVQYYNPDTIPKDSGNIKCDLVFEPDKETVCEAGGWGWSDPGHWPVGVYCVAIFLDSEKIIEVKFTVTED